MLEIRRPLLVIQDGAGAMAGETRTTLLDKGCSNVGKEWPGRQLLCTVGGLLQKATTLAASAYLISNFPTGGTGGRCNN